MSKHNEIDKNSYPGFSTKVKPTIPVVLDRSNPFTRKLRHAFLFSSRTDTYNKYYDYASERLLDGTGSNSQVGVFEGRE